MKTLTSFSSKIILDKYRDKGFLSSEGIYLNKPEILFLSSKKLVNARFLQQKAVQPISALSSDAQAELETVAETQATYESKTMHVKFQLQKECLFGEQFFLVGDDPILGLWDPTSAIPLDWSDGHIWNIELDIPVGKSIQFKFILRESTGDFVWQPGPDRIFQTWETKNTITVCEDWENAEYQKITEEDPTVNSEMMVADNITQPEKTVVSNIHNAAVAVDSEMNLASSKMLGEKQISQPEEESVGNKNTRTEEDVLGSNVRATAVKNLAVENVGYPQADHVLDAENNMHGEKKISQLEKEYVTNKKMMTEKVLENTGKASMTKNLAVEKQINQPEEESVANKNLMTGEDVLGKIGRATKVKNLESTDVKGNLITHEGDAVLVPGLTPLAMSTEGEIQDEDQKSIPVDDSVGINEAMNYTLPELDEKQEPESVGHEKKKIEIFNDEEQQLDDELKQMPRMAKPQQQPDAKPLESDVVQNDIQWGRRTLQTLLANLGLR